MDAVCLGNALLHLAGMPFREHSQVVFPKLVGNLFWENIVVGFSLYLRVPYPEQFLIAGIVLLILFSFQLIELRFLQDLA